MKIFTAEGMQKTQDVETEIILTFPGHVDHVALAGFLNDHQITYQFHFERVGSNVWKAVVRRTGEQREWAPAIRVIGFQL
jgi:hypothetical protein